LACLSELIYFNFDLTDDSPVSIQSPRLSVATIGLRADVVLFAEQRHEARNS